MTPNTRKERFEQTEYHAERSCHLAGQAVLSAITATLGISFVPDLFAALQTRPAYLEATRELFKTNLDLLDDPAKRIVALAITINRSGTYLISALPRAFRRVLWALGDARRLSRRFEWLRLSTDICPAACLFATRQRLVGAVLIP